MRGQVGEAGGGLAQLVLDCIKLRDRDGVLEHHAHAQSAVLAPPQHAAAETPPPLPHPWRWGGISGYLRAAPHALERGIERERPAWTAWASMAPTTIEGGAVDP